MGGSGGLARVRVLVVDDEPEICRMVARALRGLKVDAATGSTAAISAIAQIDYDVVICDYTMPHMSGQELYENVCAKNPELSARFIFISGGAFTKEAEIFLDALPQGRRLDKPFSPRGLVDAVKAAVARAGRHAVRG